jgi:predicted acylesterase/phospholipase RssA
VPDPYSPERRTALVLTGTGADGAYHAGVLRALHETGIKIDIVSGRGIGALGAVLYAIDGAAPLWETGGVWRRSARRDYYRWRWPFRWMRALVVALAAVLAAPLAFVLLLSLVYPVALTLGMAGLESGSSLAARVASILAALFAPGALPTWIPRVATLLALAAVSVLVGGAVLAWLNAPARRTRARHALWTLLGAPVDAGAAVNAATNALWNILRGGAQLRVPDARDLSRRYADLLSENLGQPGFRELLLVVHDLDVGRDMVFGLLGDPFRKPLFAATTASSNRRAEAHDLAGVGRDHLVDVLAASLTLPGLCNPRLVTFSTDAYWRGETHRLTDRTSAVGRVLEEVAAAGAEQVIVVSAAPEPPGPHELRPVRTDGMGRAGELLAGAETVALGDALRHLQHRFQGVYVIRPPHNPVRPLDLDDAYDERSDRRHSVNDVMERAYEDAYRQFIEPILGASGEQLDG